MEVPKRGITIMEGVDADCTLIINKFVEKRTYSFDVFLHLWNSIGFDCIYFGRTNHAELKYFTTEILIIAKRVILNEFSDYEQTAGIYLMYLLMITQPLAKPQKIRVTKSEFTILFELAARLKEICLEASICLYTLFHSESFHFVYSDVVYAKERQNSDGDVLAAAERDLKLEKRKRLKKIFTAIGFNEDKWHKLETESNELKDIINPTLPPEWEKLKTSDFLGSLFRLPEPEPVKIEPKPPKKKSIPPEKCSRPQRKGLRAIIVEPEEDVNPEPDQINSSLELPIIEDQYNEEGDKE